MDHTGRMELTDWMAMVNEMVNGPGPLAITGLVLIAVDRHDGANRVRVASNGIIADDILDLLHTIIENMEQGDDD